MLTFLQFSGAAILLWTFVGCCPIRDSCTELNDFVKRNNRIVTSDGQSNIKSLCGMKALHWDHCSRYTFAPHPQDLPHCPQILTCHSTSDIRRIVKTCKGNNDFQRNSSSCTNCSTHPTLSISEEECLRTKSNENWGLKYKFRQWLANVSRCVSNSSKQDISEIQCTCKDLQAKAKLYKCFNRGNCSFTEEFNTTDPQCWCRQPSKENNLLMDVWDSESKGLHEQTSCHTEVTQDDIYCFCDRQKDLIAARNFMDAALFNLYANATHLSAYMNQTSQCVRQQTCFRTTEIVAQEYAKWIKNHLKPKLMMTSHPREHRKCNVITESRYYGGLYYVSKLDTSVLYQSNVCHHHPRTFCTNHYLYRFQELLNKASEIIRAFNCLSNYYAQRCKLADSCSATYSLKVCMESPGLYSLPVEQGPTSLTWSTLVSEVKNKMACSEEKNSLSCQLLFERTAIFKSETRTQNIKYVPC